MNLAIQFKILQRQNKFNNPKSLVRIPENFLFTESEYKAAENYLKSLNDKNINYTYPGHEDYPKCFYRMKNPPLFLEYIGRPLWKETLFLGVVGSRKMSSLSKDWISEHLKFFLEKEGAGVVSGGAYGVDQWSHLTALKYNCPTVIILPSGLEKIYPSDLQQRLKLFDRKQICFISEFEVDHSVKKSFFFHRNRLIAALAEMLLVIQAQVAGGTMLTVHHALEIGRPILTIPSHPLIPGFSGNLSLLNEGASLVASGQALSDFWQSELNELSAILSSSPTNRLDQRL